MAVYIRCTQNALSSSRTLEIGRYQQSQRTYRHAMLAATRPDMKQIAKVTTTYINSKFYDHRSILHTDPWDAQIQALQP